MIWLLGDKVPQTPNWGFAPGPAELQNPLSTGTTFGHPVASNSGSMERPCTFPQISAKYCFWLLEFVTVFVTLLKCLQFCLE